MPEEEVKQIDINWVNAVSAAEEAKGGLAALQAEVANVQVGPKVVLGTCPDKGQGKGRGKAPGGKGIGGHRQTLQDYLLWKLS